MFLEGGNVVNPGPNSTEEVFPVTIGSLKFDVTIEDFGFCDENSDNIQCKGDLGAGLELQINVKGTKEAEKSDKNATFDLGDGLAIDVSNIISADGELGKMEDGFPLLETSGGKSIMTFRFPTFSQNVTYDPILSGFQVTTMGPASTTTASFALLGLSMVAALAGAF